MPTKKTSPLPRAKGVAEKKKKYKPTFTEIYIRKNRIKDIDRQNICFLMERYGEWASTKTVLRAISELVRMIPLYSDLQSKNASLEDQIDQHKQRIDQIKENINQSIEYNTLAKKHRDSALSLLK